jgi:hypothetical protein
MKIPIPEAEQARWLREHATKGFLQLTELLGDDVKALRAMREESAFIRARPTIPRGDDFAAKVRGWLVAKGLEWSQENLQAAVEAVLGRQIGPAITVTA